MELATRLAPFLTPFLPHLLKLGKPVAEEAGKALGGKLGEGTWETAKLAWGKLAAKVTEKPLAKGAAQALADNEQDDEAKEVWLSQLKNVLAANPELAQDLQGLLDKETDAVAQVVSVTQRVRGENNIVIGHSSGSINITQGSEQLVSYDLTDQSKEFARWLVKEIEDGRIEDTFLAQFCNKGKGFYYFIDGGNTPVEFSNLVELEEARLLLLVRLYEDNRGKETARKYTIKPSLCKAVNSNFTSSVTRP